MSSRKENLQVAAPRNCKAVEPEPPADLWAQLDALMGPPRPAMPPCGSFTLDEIAMKYSITENCARKRLRDLINAGKVEKLGLWERKAYYRVK